MAAVSVSQKDVLLERRRNESESKSPIFRIAPRMKRYDELDILGNGAFGTVTRCKDKETGEIVAIKKMKQRYASFDECLQLKEVKSLRKIKHPNVVKLLQVFRENECLHLVFELLGKSLLKTITDHGPHSEEDVKGIMFQILTGLAGVHRQGFFHRDLKPDNLLWQDQTLKIADFGLAREIRSRPPFTEYCGTRWYRAPEIILRSEFYNSPVDIWSAGAIMAELFLGRAVFQGTSETDQIYKIFGILGTPNQKTWPDGIKFANRIGIRFPTAVPTGIASVLPHISPVALSLLTDMLRFDPARRPSAAQALQHEWFGGAPGPQEVLLPGAPTQQRRAMIAEPGLDEILSTLLGASDSGDKDEQGESVHPADGKQKSLTLNETEDLFAGL
jgi:protein kinase